MSKYTPLYESDQLTYWPYYQTSTGCFSFLIAMSLTSLLLGLWLTFSVDFMENIIVFSVLGLMTFASLLGAFAVSTLRYTMIQISSIGLKMTSTHTRKNVCVLWGNVIGVEHQIQPHYGLQWYIILYIDPNSSREGNCCHKSIRLPLRSVEQNKIDALISENIRKTGGEPLS